MRGVLLGIGALVGLAVTAGVILTVTGGNDDSGPEFRASTSVDLTAGTTTIQYVIPNPANPTELPADVKDQVLGALGRYVDEGIVAPLRSGKVDDTTLAEIFDAAAVARLAGADRTVVVDEGLPKAVGKVSVTTPAVDMTAMKNADGTTLFVSVNVEFKISAQAAKGTVQITRTGSFVVAPDPTTGWKITAWTLHVDRAGPGITPPTTLPTPSTTAVK